MFNNNCYERDNDINNTFVADNMDVDVNAFINNSNYSNMNMGISSQPIMEPLQERVVNRTIVHDVNHICPVRTLIINHHVFRHYYQTTYSCCEENVCETECNPCHR